MKKILPILLLALLPRWAGAAGPQEDEKQTIVIQQAPEEKPKLAEQMSEMIGMEAYREVMASGQYLVGPGDQFLVHVPGLEEPAESKVLAEGGLFIPRVGVVRVGGMRLRDAHRAIQEAYRGAVRVGGEVQAELIAPRSFPVPVVGLVQTPGLVQSRGVERVSEVLIRTGEARPATASRRNIRVIKTAFMDPAVASRARTLARAGQYEALAGQVSQRVDLDLYEVTGESRYNPFVEDGDIIVVGAQQGIVMAREAVQRPAVYEYVPGDRLSDLLTLALGPTPNHDPANAKLFRYVKDTNKRVELPVDLEKVLAGEDGADLPLQADDWLVIRLLPTYHRRGEARIVGEVKYPGYYVVEKGKTTLREIIERAGSFTDDAALAEARVVRQKQSQQEEDIDPEFERIRTIPVSDRSEEDNQYFIMKSRERKGQMVVDFIALFDRSDESQNIQLLPGDAIVVPAQQRVVVVSGQAAHPGSVIYDSSYTVADYILRAGGLGWRASKDVLVIKARTGEIKRAREVKQVEPGDRIWIKEKPERDYWALFTQTMGVIGQVSTLVLLYATLTN
ncbi:MAG: SLBB domain-containing protein [Candidatus Handelsmanbacteria bacterium]|nr:SLBB domain-containing protein [Candidatus Handelsmanbacteria bacterium]